MSAPVDHKVEWLSGDRGGLITVAATGRRYSFEVREWGSDLVVTLRRVDPKAPSAEGPRVPANRLRDLRDAIRESYRLTFRTATTHPAQSSTRATRGVPFGSRAIPGV